MNAHAPDSPGAAIRVMRMIAIALVSGVTLFAGVAWLVQPAAPAPGEAPPVVYLWFALATTLAAGALVVWRGRVVPHLGDGRGDAWDAGVAGDAGDTGDAGWRDRAARIQTGLVITWALVETAALFGVVVYFLEGHVLPAAVGVALMWAAVALTWPRREWLGAERAAPR